jgi:hypothetical protein
MSPCTYIWSVPLPETELGASSRAPVAKLPFPLLGCPRGARPQNLCDASAKSSTALTILACEKVSGLPLSPCFEPPKQTRLAIECVSNFSPQFPSKFPQVWAVHQHIGYCFLRAAYALVIVTVTNLFAVARQPVVARAQLHQEVCTVPR